MNPIITFKYNKLIDIDTQNETKYDQYGESYGEYTKLLFTFDDGVFYKIQFDDSSDVDFQKIVKFFYGKDFSNMCAEEFVQEFCKQTYAHITDFGMK